MCIIKEALLYSNKTFSIPIRYVVEHTMVSNTFIFPVPSLHDTL